MLSRDPERLGRFVEARLPDDGRLLFAIILVPGAPSLDGPSVELLQERCRFFLIGNGLSAADAESFESGYRELPLFQTSAVTGFPAKHGTVLTLLLRGIDENFGVLDDDCVVRDPTLFAPPDFGSSGFLAVPDHPHFYTINQPTGLRFPRTHFLVFHRQRLIELMRGFSISAEKYVTPPRRLGRRLREIGIGVDNYPRTYLRHFDTLLLLIAAAYAQQLDVLWLPARPESILHWKHLTAGLPTMAKAP